MLIKFFRNGQGGGSGPVNYLVERDVVAYDQNRNAIRDERGEVMLFAREPLPEVLRGDADRMRALIDVCPHQWTYRAGVIAFTAEDGPNPAQQRQVMDAFESLAFAGLEPDQHDMLWVRHTHEGRVELHFVTPRMELASGRSLNIAPPGYQKHYDALRDVLNKEYGWNDPMAPERARETVSLIESVRRGDAALDSPASRFKELQDEKPEEAELWRGKLSAFCSLYGFLSQIIPYQDTDLERLYVFLRHLATKLPKRGAGPSYQFDDEVRLEYYRLQKISEGSISFSDGQANRLEGPSEVGSGILREEAVPLSRLIDVVNERFGTDFNQADQFFFDQLVEVAVSDAALKQAAAVNPADKFELVFKNLLEALFVERMDQNEEIFARFVNDKSFQKVVTGWLSSEAYRKLRLADAMGLGGELQDAKT
ncbi:relaxase/mobilization nuclease domain-containing protein [Agrobacterium sp. 22117]|uniref:relaxase/mobilization nuclease domain-containing protein n=1 Tax=Agrobacterium sp. 22117 TaxID=3453880 RepID=UPI003F86A9A1